MPGAVVLSPGAAADLERLAADAYPDEGCGVLVGLAGEPLQVTAVTAGTNLAARAHDRYELDPLDILRAEREAGGVGMEVVGFWHSHPDHPAAPSRLDTERAWPDYLYVIASTSARGTGEVRAWMLSPGNGGFREVSLVDGAAPGVRPARPGAAVPPGPGFPAGGDG